MMPRDFLKRDGSKEGERPEPIYSQGTKRTVPTGPFPSSLNFLLSQELMTSPTPTWLAQWRLSRSCSVSQNQL